MNMKQQDQFLRWIQTELDIKYGPEEAGKPNGMNSFINDFLITLTVAKRQGRQVDLNEAVKDLDALIHNRPLTPIHNTDADWKKEGDILVHRRLPTLVKNDRGTVYNAARAIVCDISDGKNPVYREATDNELAWLNVEHPIVFPYYPKSLPGTIFVMDTGKYRALIKYQDECDEKMYPLNLYFEVVNSDGDLEPVRFMDCAKELAKLMGDE